jgi:hypothetical protein
MVLLVYFTGLRFDVHGMHHVYSISYWKGCSYDLHFLCNTMMHIQRNIVCYKICRNIIHSNVVFTFFLICKGGGVNLYL